jgi:hypothetical protein
MTVVVEGKIPPDKDWYGKCTNCKSIIKAKESELKNSLTIEKNYKWHDCIFCKAERTICFNPDGAAYVEKLKKEIPF